MVDREKVIRGIEACVNGGILMQCSVCPYYKIHQRCLTTLMRDGLALLKERGPKVKPQFDDDALDRNAYIKVGDLIDCMTELSMPEDAAFHLTGAIEWACGKRAVALPKEQEPRVMDNALLLEYDDAVWIENKRDIGTILSICKSADNRQFRFFSKNEWENVAYLRENYGKTWRCWTSRPSPEQMASTPWKGEEHA